MCGSVSPACAGSGAAAVADSGPRAAWNELPALYCTQCPQPAELNSDCSADVDDKPAASG